MGLGLGGSLVLLGSAQVSLDLSQEDENSLEGRGISESLGGHLEEGLNERALDVLLSREDSLDLGDGLLSLLDLDQTGISLELRKNLEGLSDGFKGSSVLLLSNQEFLVGESSGFGGGNDVSFGLSNLSVQGDDLFVELVLLGDEDVINELVGLSDVSVGLRDQVSESSDIGLVLLGSDIEIVVGSLGLNLNIGNDFLDGNDQLVQRSLGEGVHFSQVHQEGSPRASLLESIHSLDLGVGQGLVDVDGLGANQEQS